VIVAAGFHVLIRRYTREGDSLVTLLEGDGEDASGPTRCGRSAASFLEILEEVARQAEQVSRSGDQSLAPGVYQVLTGPDLRGLDRGRTGDGVHLSLTFRPGPDPEIVAVFDGSRFDPSAVGRLLDHIVNVISHGLDSPDTPVSELAMLGAEERRRIVEEWSGSEAPAPPTDSVTQRFGAQAASTPDAIAVEGNGRTLTYRELDARSNSIAAALAARGVAPGSVVAVALERSVELVATLLAVLKRGCAYLPLDTGYPDARLQLMLDDTAAPVVIADAATAGRLSSFRSGAEVVQLAELMTEAGPAAASRSAAPAPTPNHEDVVTTPEDLAYVIYTSGSTGRPKGVRVLHRGITRLVRDQPWAEVGPGSRVLSFAPVSFDAATFEIWYPLLNGGTVVVAPPGPMTTMELGRFLESERIDTCWLTAGLFQQMVAGGVERLRPLRQILTGGDVVSPGHAREALEAIPGLTLVNGYGPTENTTFTTCHVMRGPDEVGSRVSIGRPITFTTVYVLDPDGRPVPPGVPGELCTGGSGVADGYVGLPEATAERFIPDPFGSGGRLYRTGDLVRWNDDGTLDFLGRIDGQLKIAGFRIEPGEVEARLTAHPGVREAVVRARGDAGERRLVAWIVPVSADSSPEPGALREWCRSGLPDYMVPVRVIPISSLPITANGKVDHARLPFPGAGRERPSSGRGRPGEAGGSQGEGGDIQAELARLWSGLLDVDPVDPDEGFFDLGGTSLLSLRLLDEVRARFGVEVPVATFYSYPTLRSMAEWLSSKGPNPDHAAPVPDARRGAEGNGSTAAPASGPRARGARGTPRDRRIAIVGMAARVPGASNPEELWELLRSGRDGRVEYDTDELRAAGVPEERLADPDYVRAGYPLQDALGFDAAFFGLLPRQVELMDPQQRLFLELAWSAVESAGYAPRGVPGRVGVFGGVGRNSYLINNLATRPELADLLGEHQGLVGNLNDFPTTHVSFHLGLDGPSVNVQTACSTSGVAVHLAAQSLLSGECDAALAGGCKILVPHEVGYQYTEGGALSAGGRIRAFDAGADGMVRGSGGAMLMLKRYTDAVADGDEILGVILGSATNNDGAHRAGFSAPSPVGQSRVIGAALEAAGVRADTIGYVEAHGTGTILGDPIEVDGLTRAFRPTAEDNGFCGLGSIKSSIGHLDAGATAAGIVKVLLAFRHEELPATANFERPNPHIDFRATPFYVVDRPRPWLRGAAPRRAGVSSFGLGGSNAHIVLEEPPVRTGASVADARPGHLLVLSARSPAALDRATADLHSHLTANPGVELGDVARTLQEGRHAFQHRRAVAVADREEALALLATPGSPRIRTADADDASAAPAFLFPGQGAQHLGMGHGLYVTEPAYRRTVDRCADLLRDLTGADLREVMWASPDETTEARLQGTDWAQPALFVHQVAMVDLLASWGIRPGAVAGHSIGEFAAALTAGVMELDDALRLVAVRGRLMQEQPAGSMAAVPLPEGDLRPWLEPDVSIAALNAPGACVISGPDAALRTTLEKLEAAGHEPRMLHTSHAFHSSMMDPVVERFHAEMASTELRPPALPFISTVTGTRVDTREITAPEYWARQLREPVRFAAAVEALHSGGHELFLDVGPGAVTASLARRILPAEARGGVVSASRHPSLDTDDRVQLLDAVGSLWVRGGAPDWRRLHHGREFRRVRLPTYPFERTIHEIPPLATAALERPSSASTATDSTSPELSPSAKESPVAAPAPADRVPVLVGEIRSLLFELSGLAPETLDAEATFLELGFDSLFLAQVGGGLRKRFGIRVGVRTLLDGTPTIQALARHLDGELPPEAFRPAVEETRATAAMPVHPASSTPAPTAPLPSAGAALQVSGPQPAVGTSAPTVGQDVAGLIQQQLQLMQQQLALITGGAVQAVAPGPPAPAPSPIPPLSSEPTRSGSPAGSEQPERTHGPWRPLKRSSEILDERRGAAVRSLVERVNELTSGSKAFMARYRGTLADPRSVVGFRSEWKDLVYQIVVDSACGGQVRDVDGNVFVDVVGAFGANFLGHSPEYVTRAVEEELRRGFAIGPQTALAGEVAQLVSELTGMERVALCNTGSEAVLAALRICRTVRGRDRIATFSGHYHGIFDEVLVKAVDVAGRRKNFPVAPGIPQHAVEPVLVLDYGEDSALDAIRAEADELACVILEPVRSRNPDLQPVDFVRRLRALTEELGIPLIFDEMVTGFRAHPGGAQATFGVRADLATYGKAMGGGYPIGVVAGRPEFMDALDGGAWEFGDDSVPEADMTWFAGTFVRHPVSLAAARASLTWMKERGPALQEGLNARNAAWVAEMNRWFEENDVPLHFESYASLFLPTWTCHQEYADLLTHYLLTHGVFAREQRPLFWSAGHTDADWEQVARGYRESALEMQAAGLLTNRDGGPVTPGPAHARFSDSVPEVRVPLTEPQREVWVATQLGDGASASFNLSLRFAFQGELDVAAMRTSLQALVDRHEALRATFDPDGEYQTIHPRVALDVPVEDLSEREAEDLPGTLERIERDEVCQPFDLAAGPMVRARIVRLAQDRWQLLLTVHHIVADGWACGVLAKDLGALYTAEVRQETPALGPVMQLGEYVRHLDTQEEREARAEAEAFWEEELDPVPEPVALPADRPRPVDPDFAAGHLRIALDPQDVRKIRDAAGRLGATLFSYTMAAFDAHVHLTTGQEDVVVGFDLAGQALVPGRDLVCHAVSFLPLRVRVDRASTFAELVARVRGSLLGVIEHQRMTFGGLMRLLRLAPDPDRRPLISVSFNLDPSGLETEFGGLETMVDSLPRGFETNDLFLNLVERSGDRLEVQCTYNRALFDADTMERRLQGYLTLLRATVDQPDAPLSTLPTMSPEEAALLDEWNRTEVEWPRESTLHGLVDQGCAADPGAVAISAPDSDGEDELTFEELGWRSDALAALLQERGVGPGDRVAVSMHRSAELIVALLAVLKSGGAYVPVDPGYPEARRAFMLSDSGASLLLTQRALLPDVPVGTEPLVIEDLWPDLARGVRPTAAAGPDDPAYVIYTSGSTGQPKGAIIHHRAAVNRMRWMMELHGIDDGDVILQKTPTSFDVSVWELFLPPAAGARMVLAGPERQGDAAYLAELVRRAGVTTMHFVPSMLAAFLDEPAVSDLASLRRVVCSGEVLPPSLRDRFLSILPDTELWNLYGPTEAAVDVSAHRCRPGDPERTVPIGGPVANTQLYVLAPGMSPLPVGVPGELYIGGVQVGLGYLGREDLTAERFVEDPFTPGGRLYRTGDRARWLPSGEIEYLGRLDNQVKVRGFRIELEEIEAALRALEGVDEAAVAAPELRPGDRTLVAYVRGPAGAAPDQARRELAARLPDHMIPTRWVQLDRFPLNASGKVDRSRLPEPERLEAGTRSAMPETDTEREVARIWSEILGVDGIGVDDDFFALGGHSILATRAVARIRTEIGVEIPLRRLFAVSRLRDFAEEIEVHRLASSLASGPDSGGADAVEEMVF
jgi:amino acid adenylation domain-containing protein